MTTSITGTALMDLCRDRGEIRSTYIGDTELLAMINAAIADIHRLILAHDPDRLLTSELISVVSGTASYAVNAAFLRCMGVDLLLSSGLWVNVEPFDWGRRNTSIDEGDRRYTTFRIMNAALVLEPTPDWSEANGLKHWYFPIATQLATGASTWNSVGYWHEYVVLKVQWMACAKSGEDPSLFASLLQDMKKDLISSMTSQMSGPGKARDVYAEFRTRNYGVP